MPPKKAHGGRFVAAGREGKQPPRSAARASSSSLAESEEVGDQIDDEPSTTPAQEPQDEAVAGLTSQDVVLLQDTVEMLKSENATLKHRLDEKEVHNHS